MITVDELTISDGEVVIIDSYGEVIAWMPAKLTGTAIIKDGYRIITSICDAVYMEPELREQLTLIKGGK